MKILKLYNNLIARLVSWNKLVNKFFLLNWRDSLFLDGLGIGITDIFSFIVPLPYRCSGVGLITDDTAVIIHCYYASNYLGMTWMMESLSMCIP